MSRANFTIGPSRYDEREAFHSCNDSARLKRSLPVDADRAGNPHGQCRAPALRPRAAGRTRSLGSPGRAARRLRPGLGHQRGRASSGRARDGRANARGADNHQPDVRGLSPGSTCRRGLRPLLDDPLPALRPAPTADLPVGSGISGSRRTHVRPHPHVRSAADPGALPRRLRRPHQHGRGGVGWDRSPLPPREARRRCAWRGSRGLALRGVGRRPYRSACHRQQDAHHRRARHDRRRYARRCRPRRANCTTRSHAERRRAERQHRNPGRRASTGADPRVRSPHYSEHALRRAPCRLDVHVLWTRLWPRSRDFARPAPSPACAPAPHPGTSSATTIRGQCSSRTAQSSANGSGHRDPSSSSRTRPR